MNHINNDDNFNDLFRDRFQDFEDNNVSEHNWDAIQSAIASEPSFWQRNKGKSGVLLLLLLISTCAYPLLHTPVAPVNEGLTTIKIDNSIEKRAVIESARPLSNLTNNTASTPIINLKNAFNTNAIKKTNTPKQQIVNVHAINDFNANLMSNKNVIIDENNAIMNNANNLVASNSTINKTIEQTDLMINKIAINNDNNAAINNSTINKTVINTNLMTHKINNENNIVIDSLTTSNSINNNSIKNNQLKKRHFYFLMTPQYSFFKFSPNTADKIYLSNFELTNSLSIKRLGIQLEAGISYELSKKWQANVGVNAQIIRKNINYSTRTNVLDSFRIEALNASNIRIERVADLNKIQEENNYYSIGLTADLMYNINNKKDKFNWFLLGGFGVNQLLNQTQSRAVNVNAAIGFKHKLNNQFDLIVSPKLTYFIEKNSFSSLLLQAQPYTIGVQIGISMR